MALSNTTKIDKSFRALINKEFSTTSKKFYEEFGANTINTSTSEVWSQVISSTPATAVNDGVARLYTDFVLSPLQGYANEAFYFVSGSGWTPGDEVNRPLINENLLQRNFISSKYGSSYNVILKDNNSTIIEATDAIDWQFDYMTGILNIQDPGAGTYSTPYKLTAYQYIGKFASASIGESVKTGSVAGSTLTFEKNDGTTFDLTVAGGSSPGGNDSEIQFNSGGTALGGSPRFTFDSTGLTRLSGSFQITSSTANDIFLVKSGSIEVAKVNNDGVFVLGEMAETPTAVEGGMYYSASNFYVGTE